MDEQNNQKKRAAEEAVHLVEDGLFLGMASGPILCKK